MKFDISADKKPNFRRHPTTSAADQGVLTQIVRLKHTTNQNQKLIKSLITSLNEISELLYSNFDIRGSKNNIKENDLTLNSKIINNNIKLNSFKYDSCPDFSLSHEFDMTECLPTVNESQGVTRQNRGDKTCIPNSITTSIPNMNVTEWVDPPLDKFTKYDQECLSDQQDKTGLSLEEINDLRHSIEVFEDQDRILTSHIE